MTTAGVGKAVGAGLYRLPERAYRSAVLAARVLELAAGGAGLDELPAKTRDLVVLERVGAE